MSDKKGWTTDEDLDMANQSTEPPPPLEDGIHGPATIVKAEPEATNKGQPGAKIELSVTDASGRKRKVYDKVVFTKEAAFRVKQLALAVGVEAPARSTYELVEEFCGAVTGQEVWLKTKRQTFENKVNAKVDMYLTAEKAATMAAGGEGGEAAAEGARPKRRRT